MTSCLFFGPATRFVFVCNLQGGNLQGGLKKPQTTHVPKFPKNVLVFFGVWDLVLQKSETFVMNMTDEMKALANNAVSWVLSRFRCLCFVLVPNNRRKSQVQVFVVWKPLKFRVCCFPSVVWNVWTCLFQENHHCGSFYIWYCFIEIIFILKLLLLHKTYIDTIYIYDIYTPGVWNMFVLYFLWVERLKPSKRFFHSKQGSQFVFHIYIFIWCLYIYIYIHHTLFSASSTWWVSIWIGSPYPAIPNHGSLDHQPMCHRVF